MRSRTAGFTLVEMIVVITIIAILSTATLVNVDRLNPMYNLRAAARQVASTMETCWSFSVLHGQPFRLAIALDEGRYQVLQPASWDADKYGEFPEEELNDGVVFELLELPGGDTPDQAEIEFSPYGNQGSCVVGLRLKDDDLHYYVRFNGLVGVSAFSESKPEFHRFEGGL